MERRGKEGATPGLNSVSSSCVCALATLNPGALAAFLQASHRVFLLYVCVLAALGPGALAAFLQTSGQARVPATMAQVRKGKER
eukprot:scaffold198164_cov18-Tisochrysis_lutea.AAC.1